MNDKSHNSADDSDSLDALCDRFEQRFAENCEHRIEILIREIEQALSFEFLAELIRLEIDLRNGANQRPDRFEYRERFPNHEKAIEEAFRNIDEIDVVFSTHTETNRDDETGIGILDGGQTEIPRIVGNYEIHEKLGAGSFGIVYRAIDTNSGQPVALKFPRRRVMQSLEELERFLEEAAAAKSLDHPGIVKTYACEHIDGLVFIVQQFVDGEDLSSLIGSGASFKKVVQILARASDAVAHAHQKGYVHRDLKPSNILLDRAGNPYIADFGLAIHESVQRVLKGQRCGSVGYMSPELVQGLSHQLDSRSDIWSLGVILYYLLTGRHPFAGDTRDEVFDEIKNLDARPLRMFNPEIDVELQRICLRCLNKRKSDRYSTADELAADLRAWLDEPVHPKILAPIVPKGLRSYGEEDAEFFLQLLPGPTDKNGLPESIRFWKTRIEKTNGEGSFPLGVIFGPSGCGKSSFIKAGLLPRLDQRLVKSVYVESTSTDTEVRLMKSLRAAFVDIPQRISLPDFFHSIKQQLWSHPDKKVLIVLDQFEQWLYSADEEQETQLMEALRHCDGTTLQCIVTVRDDFWVKISTFMNDLDVHLNEEENVRRLDRFTINHARNILAEIGRAYECLPSDLTQLSKEQNVFLDEAIKQLSEDNRVISVRLALTAVMFKNRAWTRAELKRVGGVSGIGEKFLDETFAADNAPPQYKVHYAAAQSVLMELLPESGRHIRGHLRSLEKLLAVSKYQTQPDQFENLIDVLDHDLHLVTPTDPDGTVVANKDSQTESKKRHFQLTHDYLVPSIRNWLTRKKKESMGGRAELRLAECAELWNLKQENRQLPKWWEYVRIRFLTNRVRWNLVEQKLMRKAGLFHGFRTTACILVLITIVWISRESLGSLRSEALIDQLLNANITQVPTVIGKLDPYKRWVMPRLRQIAIQPIAESNTELEGHQLHIALALLRVDKNQLGYVTERLLNASPNEVQVIREELLPYKDQLLAELWDVVENSDPNDDQLLLAASTLALFDAENTRRWNTSNTALTDRLVNVPTIYVPNWMEMLRPISSCLLEPLLAVYQDVNRTQSERSLAIDFLAVYSAENPAILVSAIETADPEQFEILIPLLIPHKTEASVLLANLLASKIRIEPSPSIRKPTWQSPSRFMIDEISRGDGLITPEFALCQSIPLNKYLTLVEKLRPYGYRPTCCRPYVKDSSCYVAGVWHRDSDDWQLAVGSAAEIRKRNQVNSAKGLPIADIAGFPLKGDGGEEPRFAAIWSTFASGSETRRLLVGLNSEDWSANFGQLESDGFCRLEAYESSDLGATGEFTSGICSRSPVASVIHEVNDQQPRPADLSLLQVDVRLGARPTTLWQHNASLESNATQLVSASEHLKRARSFQEQGFYPVVITFEENRVSSIWHRPIVSEKLKDH